MADDPFISAYKADRSSVGLGDVARPGAEAALAFSLGLAGLSGMAGATGAFGALGVVLGAIGLAASGAGLVVIGVALIARTSRSDFAAAKSALTLAGSPAAQAAFVGAKAAGRSDADAERAAEIAALLQNLTETSFVLRSPKSTSAEKKGQALGAASSLEQFVSGALRDDESDKFSPANPGPQSPSPGDSDGRRRNEPREQPSQNESTSRPTMVERIKLDELRCEPPLDSNRSNTENDDGSRDGRGSGETNDSPNSGSPDLPLD